MIQRSMTFTFRLTPNELARLSELARRLADSQANIIRRALAGFADIQQHSTRTKKSPTGGDRQ